MSLNHPVWYPTTPLPDLTDAACARTDPELFFPDGPGESRQAVAVCQACPVVEACRTWALRELPPMGVWGGTTATERARLSAVDSVKVCRNGHPQTEGNVAVHRAAGMRSGFQVQCLVCKRLRDRRRRAGQVAA